MKNKKNNLSVWIALLIFVAVVSSSLVLWSSRSKQSVGIKVKSIFTITATKKLGCTKMSTNNSCNGLIIYKINGGNELEGVVTNETSVYDSKSKEFDGALLYRADKSPMKAEIEINPINKTIAKIILFD